jgi:hypothetical protein
MKGPETGDVRYSVALDHVAQQRDIRVIAEDPPTYFTVHALDLGVPSGLEVAVKPGPEHSPLARIRRPHVRDGDSRMRERLREAEGQELVRERSPAQRCRNFTAQHPRRRAGHDDARSPIVHQPPYEALPARHDLDLIEQEPALPVEKSGHPSRPFLRDVA